MGLFGSATQVGVSIGTSSIKVVELQKRGKTFNLLHFGLGQLPDEAIQNREIINSTAVIDCLRNLVTQLKIKGRSVITSLSGAGVIVKKILLDPTPSAELDDAILWEAEQYVPFDIQEVVYDYQIINKSGPEGKMEILLVACKKNIIDSYLNVFKEAGLNANIVDVDMFALQNSFEANYPSDTPAALVDVGASSLKMVICANKTPVFTRDSAIGGRSLTSDIQKHMNLSFNEAELLKIDGNAADQVPQELVELIQITNENIASEIKRSIDFYIASNSGPPVSFVLLAGGSARISNLSKIVENVVGLPVQTLNPFSGVGYDSKIFSDDYIRAISGSAAVPVGLAIRGFSK